MSLVKAAYDLVVIGAGSGGLEAAWNAATIYKANVAVIDMQTHHGPPNYAAIGGTCVNVGCVPKKLFVIGANYHEAFKDAKGFGWDLDASKIPFNWRALRAGKDKAVSGINDSYQGMFRDTEGLNFVQGRASFKDKGTVIVKNPSGEETHELAAKKVLVACGGWPQKPSLPGIEHTITSNEAFYLEEVPKRLLVVGGGYIAVEFASIFQSFKPEGGQVSLAYRGDLFLRGFDLSVREELRDQMQARGVNLMFNTNPASIKKNDNGTLAVTFEDGKTAEYDCVMYATGRTPATATLNAAAAGVKLAKNGAIEVDAHSRTAADGVYAIGDVTDRVQLTPVAIHEARCVIDTAFGPTPVAPNHKNVASAVFAIPQIGSVGMTEEKAATTFKTVAIYKSRSPPLMHQLTGQSHKNFLCKVVVDHATGTVVGVHLCGGEAAGEIIQGVGIAVKMGAKISDFYDTIGVHPTSAEELCSMREPAYFLVGGQKYEKLPSQL